MGRNIEAPLILQPEGIDAPEQLENGNILEIMNDI